MKEEKEIRQQILDSLPEKGSPNASSFIKAEYLERQEAKKRKKGGFRLVWAMPIAAAVLAVAIVTPLAINGNNGVIDPVTPSSGASGGNDSGGGVTPTPQVLSLEAKHEEVAENLESGIHFLSSSVSELVPANRLLALFGDDGEAAIPDDVLLSHLEDLNPFLPTAERMMSGQNSASSLTYMEGEEYPYALLTEDGDVLRYKETRLEGKEDDEEEFYLEGFIEKDGNTYSMKGTREKEVSSSEAEYETEFTISLEGYSITIESENESESGEYEESYKYLYKEGNRTLLEVQLDYENEVGEEEQMTIEVKTYGKEAKYYLYESTSGFSLAYEIKGSENDYKGSLSITISETQYIYKDSGGKEVATLARG